MSFSTQPSPSAITVHPAPISDQTTPEIKTESEASTEPDAKPEAEPILLLEATQAKRPETPPLIAAPLVQASDPAADTMDDAEELGVTEEALQMGARNSWVPVTDGCGGMYGKLDGCENSFVAD